MEKIVLARVTETRAFQRRWPLGRGFGLADLKVLGKNNAFRDKRRTTDIDDALENPTAGQFIGDQLKVRGGFFNRIKSVRKLAGFQAGPILASGHLRELCAEPGAVLCQAGLRRR